MEPAQLPSQRTFRYWARRGSKGRRGGTNGTGNSHPKVRHYTKLLVDHARSRGFVNGILITKGRMI